MPSLRERRHLETKQALSDAAFALFDEQGFTKTTMEQIAERAEVSRSTAYRRFASKEDIVLEVPHRWLRVWDDAIKNLDPTASLSDSLAVGCRAIATEIDESHIIVRAAFQALSESPTLQASTVASADWIERMVDLVERKEPDFGRIDAMIIAGAYLGAIDTMMMTWATNATKTSVLASTDRVLELLDRILDSS